MESDVIVVGSGGSGLIAALHAAVRGARVTVLEKAPVFGGTTSLSGGSHWLPGNPLGPKRFGTKESLDDAERYLNSLSLGKVPKTVHAFVQAAPQYFEFLTANTVLQIEAADIPDFYLGVPGAISNGRTITIGPYDTNRLGEYKALLRVPPEPGPSYITMGEQDDNWAGRLDTKTLNARAEERRKQGIAVRGRALVGSLLEAGLKHKVQVVHSTRVTQLTQEGDRITGVVALRDGKAEKYTAKKGVVLTAGGFEWNRLIWDSIVGTPFDGPLSPPFNEGDALRMGLSVGARLGNLNQIWWAIGGHQLPGELYDGKQRTRAGGAFMGPGAITVNRYGRRFMNENMPGYDAGRPIVLFDPQRREFPNYPAFSIIDAEQFERRGVGDVDEKLYPRSGWLFEAPTLRGLAERMGVDPDGLTDEVKQWNGIAERGVDHMFHRGERDYDTTREPWGTIRNDTSSGLKNPLLRPIGAGPYYATRVRATCFGTKGGLVINDEARVMGFDDKPIPGLFAAGNSTACIYGVASPGGGSSIPPAMVYGWIAGRSVSA